MFVCACVFVFVFVCVVCGHRRTVDLCAIDIEFECIGHAIEDHSNMGPFVKERRDRRNYYMRLSPGESTEMPNCVGPMKLLVP